MLDKYLKLLHVRYLVIAPECMANTIRCLIAVSVLATTSEKFKIADKTRRLGYIADLWNPVLRLHKRVHIDPAIMTSATVCSYNIQAESAMSDHPPPGRKILRRTWIASHATTHHRSLETMASRERRISLHI
jgi:hypothetical protein